MVKKRPVLSVEWGLFHSGVLLVRGEMEMNSMPTFFLISERSSILPPSSLFLLFHPGHTPFPLNKIFFSSCIILALLLETVPKHTDFFSTAHLHTSLSWLFWMPKTRGDAYICLLCCACCSGGLGFISGSYFSSLLTSCPPPPAFCIHRLNTHSVRKSVST